MFDYEQELAKVQQTPQQQVSYTAGTTSAVQFGTPVYVGPPDDQYFKQIVDTWSGLAQADPLTQAHMKCSNNPGGKIRTILTEIIAECKYTNPDTNIVFDVASTKATEITTQGILSVDMDVHVLDSNTPDEYLDRYCEDVRSKFTHSVVLQKRIQRLK